MGVTEEAPRLTGKDVTAGQGGNLYYSDTNCHLACSQSIWNDDAVHDKAGIFVYVRC